jgi:hypothetical protein
LIDKYDFSEQPPHHQRIRGGGTDVAGANNGYTRRCSHDQLFQNLDGKRECVDARSFVLAQRLAMGQRRDLFAGRREPAKLRAVRGNMLTLT